MENQNYLYHFDKNIAYLRRANALSQKEMAKIMGVSMDTLRKIENGIPTPGINCFVPLRVSEYFHISLDSLWNSLLENN